MGDKANGILETDRASSLVSHEQGLVGRELDAAVAERVMGWRWTRSQPEAAKGIAFGKPIRQLWKNEILAAGLTWWDGVEDCYVDPVYMCIVPLYSADIAAAMEVVEKMRREGFDVEMRAETGYYWYVSFCGNARFRAEEEFESSNATLPEAICRAALATVNVPVVKEEER